MHGRLSLCGVHWNLNAQSFPNGCEREFSVIYWCWIWKLRLVGLGWDKSPPTGHVVSPMGQVERSGGMKVCVLWIWLGVVWKMTYREYWVCAPTMFPPLTWMEGKWSMQNLGGSGWAIMWFLVMAIFCKGLINRHVFKWRSTWVLLLLGQTFHMCKSGQFYPNPTCVILLGPWVWMLGGQLQPGRTWWNPMISRWKTSPISSLIPCLGLQYEVF